MPFRLVLKYTPLFVSLVLLYACKSHDQQQPRVPDDILEMDHITIYLQEDIADAGSVNLIPVQEYGETKDLKIGRIAGFIVDNAGRVYINGGTAGERTIHVYEPDGSYIKDLGPAGRGPGDFSSPGNLRIRNNKLYLYDNQLNRLSSYSTETLDLMESVSFKPEETNISGELSELRLSGIHILDDDKFLIALKRPQKHFEDEPGSYHFFTVNSRLNEFSAGLFQQDALPETWGDYRQMRIMKMFPFFSKPLSTVTPNGRIFIADSDRFLIRELSAGGEKIGGFYYPAVKFPVTRDDALKSANEMTETIAKEVNLPENWPVLESMHADDKERLWISAYTEADDEFEWMVLESTGELIAKFPRPGNRYADPKISENISHLARNGFFYALEADDDTGIQKVVKYLVDFLE